MDLETARRWWRTLNEAQRAFVLQTLNQPAVPEGKEVPARFVYYAYMARHWPTQENWPK